MERESSLGGRLRRLMEEEGLSYEQMGERLGMNPQTLNRYVLGQREPKIGTASAMAAALVAHARGASAQTTENAAEIALEHHLGLTCDPICGLVQIPCIERNAVAAVRAMNACNLSYFLTGSRNISYDMVCRAMRETGVNLDHRFRETSEGGLAKLYNRRKKQ